MVPEGIEDTQDHIPEVGQDHVAFDTEEGTILEPTGDTTVLLQGIDHAAGPGLIEDHDLVEDHIIEDPFQEADHDQEAEDTMDLGEPYTLRLTEAGEAGQEQDLVAEHLCLSEKDRRELLEIAKANAAKALGTDNVVLPASLRVYSLSKERNGGKCRSEDSAESTEQYRRLTEDLTKSGTERAPAMKGLSFSPNNTMAKPVLQKAGSLSVKETAVSLVKEDTKRNPYGQWVPMKEENGLFNFSPKSAPFRAR